MKNIARFLERVPAPVWFILITIVWFGVGYKAGSSHVEAERTQWNQVNANELTQWTQVAAKKQIPASHQNTIKTILREAYRETAALLANGDIIETADARQRVFQLIQAKIRALARSEKEEWELFEKMIPFSVALGTKLADEVRAGRIRDAPDDVGRAFSEIANGLE